MRNDVIPKALSIHKTTSDVIRCTFKSYFRQKTALFGSETDRKCLKNVQKFQYGLKILEILQAFHKNLLRYLRKNTMLNKNLKIALSE